MSDPVAATESWCSRLSVVIPAYNEEDGIVSALSQLRARLPEAEILVVDDGSSDATRDRALSVPGVTVITHTFNQGYGASLRTGMRAAVREYVAWFDADNEHRVEDLIAMVERLEAERLVAMIGRRPRVGQTILRSSGKFVIRMLARTLRVNMGEDLNCGLRVFRREVILRYVALLPDRFSASLTSSMIIFERGYPFAFHDITVNPRIGSSKVRLNDGFDALMLILRLVTLFAPLRIFFAPGLLALVAGSLYSIGIALTVGAGFPPLGVLVTITGLLLCMLGLVADQISQLRLGQLAGASPARPPRIGASETPAE